MMQRVLAAPRRGFTLIELLVVITIIAILATISVPATLRAIQLAKRIQCTANLKNIGTAAILYAQSTQRYPPGQQNGQSFYSVLKGEMGLPNIVDSEPVNEFLDPARASASTVQGPYAHFGYSSNNSIFGAPKGVPFGGIPDGERYTLLLGIMSMNPQEYLDSGQPWASGNFAISASGPPQQDSASSSSGSGFGAPYATGAPFLYADTSVRIINYTVDGQTFQALWTWNQNDPINTSYE